MKTDSAPTLANWEAPDVWPQRLCLAWSGSSPVRGVAQSG